MEKNRVLAVDDEPFNLEIMGEILSDQYELQCVDSGEACLKHLELNTPEVILLDVSMPEMDGYEVCRKLKDNPKTSDIPVMFVSARGNLDERIQGYEAGADDYIVKPFAKEELKAKLNGLFNMIDKRLSLEEQVTTATETAFNAMANSSEMGVVIQFVEHCHEIESPEQLAQALMQTLNSFGIKSNIQFRIHGEETNYSLDGACSPIVVELLSMMRHKGRIYEFAPRLLINYTNVSLLMLNLPMNDPVKVGRLRDHVCFLVGVTEQTLISLDTSARLDRKQELLEDTVHKIKDRFEDLVMMINQSHAQNVEVFSKLQRDFDQHIPGMGLDEDQELYIVKTLDETIQQALGKEDMLLDVKAAFYHIEELLSKLT
ncbi:response regulator [Algicola sagamiensis]|uniref:response regulator n=1 Tax=Algicola sagamiensis TaxID=163869 RepID=UPI00037A7D74|nr:response regulator [Algicola sagamiensis]